MLNALIIICGKIASKTVKTLGLGHGSTWPGHLALKINPNFVRDMLKTSDIKTIIIAGTNGKTTSSLMLRSVLESDGKKVLHNESGANLINGIASTLLLNASLGGKIEADYAVFEVDENALPKVLKQVSPDYILLLNLFRDQLDRYGEVATVAEKWKSSFETLPDKTILVANADDPKIAYLGMMKKNTVFFGLPKKQMSTTRDHIATDSTYCPRCHKRLYYNSIAYSHLGDWHCPACDLKRPSIAEVKEIPLSLAGIYNLSNAHGIIELSRKLGTHMDVIANSLSDIQPAFGRQEKIIVQNKITQIFLSKNPTGFNESLATIAQQKGKYIFFVLNDGAADGTDVSWIWDIDMEQHLDSYKGITISGTRAYDMGLRILYASRKPITQSKWQVVDSLEDAIFKAIDILPENETLYILPTYTAMLEVRKILTGKKIL